MTRQKGREKDQEFYEQVGSEDSVDIDMLRATEQENMYVWKPAKFVSYETMGLTSTKLNPTVRPCGFMFNGKNRQIKNTCLLGRMKKLNLLKNTYPKMAVCITMYNEDKAEFINTMKGVMQNYNAMYMDDNIKMRQEDLIVVLVSDGYEKIPEDFKEYAREHKFLDEQILREKGFMEEGRDGNLEMVPLEKLVDKRVKTVPKNVLHMF